MKSKVLTMVGIAVIFGSASLLAADFWLKRHAAAQVEDVRTSSIEEPRVELASIVVASAPLRYGMPLDPSQLTEIPWPEEHLPAGAFPTVDALLSDGERVVLSPIEINEPVLLAKLSGPGGRASLANLLAPGMRAVTIETNEIAGVGGFILPGDRVDVLLTRDAGLTEATSDTASKAAGSTITSQVVVSNAKVLSVGQAADVRETTPQVANSVTVEVGPEDARKIALARNIGTLSLTLRSAGETGGKTGVVTTISAFGATAAKAAPQSLPQAVEEKSSLFGAFAEPEKPEYSTVVVKRGMEVQTYQVVAPE